MRCRTFMTPAIQIGCVIGRSGLIGIMVVFTTTFALAQDSVVGTGTVDGGQAVVPLLNYEWNTDGDFEGWSVNNINNGTVAGGLLSGESLGDGSFPAGADPIFGGPGGLGFVIGDGPGEVNRVQFAAQFGAGSPANRTEIFFFKAAGGFGSQRWTAADFPEILDGNLHTFNIDFDSTSPLWGEAIASVRLDPVADNQNVVETFAYDYLRIGVPEPAALVLWSMVALTFGMLRRRVA